MPSAACRPNGLETEVSSPIFLDQPVQKLHSSVQPYQRSSSSSLPGKRWSWNCWRLLQMRVEDVPTRYRGLYRKAMGGRCLKASIRCYCLMCCGWQSTEVEQCTAPTCPLYRCRLGAARTESNREWAGGAEIVASPETSIMQVLSSAEALDGSQGTPGRAGAKPGPKGGPEALSARNDLGHPGMRHGGSEQWV